MGVWEVGDIQPPVLVGDAVGPRGCLQIGDQPLLAGIMRNPFPVPPSHASYLVISCSSRDHFVLYVACVCSGERYVAFRGGEERAMWYVFSVYMLDCQQTEAKHYPVGLLCR